jgi:hypothetical protein
MKKQAVQWVVGVDYSMSCPAITIFNTDQEFNFGNCVIHYLSEKVPNNSLPNVHGTRLSEYTNNEQRFDLISEWAVGCIPRSATIFIEDYSFGSKGKTFHIAENAGLVKHKLWRLGHSIHPIPPTVIKKFATGKGNADKTLMHQSFVIETGFDLMTIYQPKSMNVGSPAGDIVDSYYICKYGVEKAGD